MTTVCAALVATLITVTVAPGTTAPEASRAVPAMLPRVICAIPAAGSSRIAASPARAARTAIVLKRIIPILLHWSWVEWFLGQTTANRGSNAHFAPRNARRP